MCGITGYLTTDRSRHLNEDVLIRMTAAIRHRGPDNDGHWWDREAGVALGMRRLAILDLSPAGNQPMLSADGRFVIVFNGEIYDHRSIRAELEAAGQAPAWRGHSDTEILLAAITAWGFIPALKACNGMFAVALWDRQERVLHLAVDRLGEKPLYFGWIGDTFLFGSELKALNAHPDWAAEVNQGALALYMRFGYVPAPHCIFRGFHKLQAGTTARLRSAPGQHGLANICIEGYWSVRDTIMKARESPLAISEGDAVTQFETLLADSVRLRMESDVPLGAFLSGGFDSTAVVAMMQRQSSRAVRTFTVGFTENAYNEAPFAKSVAQHLRTEHTELYVSPQEAMAVIPSLPSMYDEPFADSSQIPTFLIAQLARQHVTVALSGDGGDELLGGYSRYFVSNKFLPAISRLPMNVRLRAASGIRKVGAGGWDALYRVLRLGRSSGHIGDRALKFASMLAFSSPVEGYRSVVSHWQDPGRIVGGIREPSTPIDDSAAWPPGLSFVEQMMFLDSITYLPGDILTKVDRASMAVSLEARIPFLDPRLLDFVWRLPLDYRVRGSVGKWLLRQLVQRHVPAKIMDRPKMGFGIPLKDWFRGPLKPWIESVIRLERLESAGLKPAPILLAWKEHQDGSRNWHYQLWPVLMYLEWKQAGMSQAAAPAMEVA